MIQTGGIILVDEDERAKMVVKEVEEVEAEEGSEGKARAGPPLLPASQPAPLPKPEGPLVEAEGKKKLRHASPVAPATENDRCCRNGSLLLRCIVGDAKRTGELLQHKMFLNISGGGLGPLKDWLLFFRSHSWIVKSHIE